MPIETPKLHGKTLIIPSVSIGNVPQLSVDLLLHNLPFEWACSMDHTLLYPFASPVDSLDDEEPIDRGISTGIELYVDETHGLALVQQRSPILPGYGYKFVQYLSQFIKESQFQSVVVLDSQDYTLKSTLDASCPIEIVSNDLSEQFKQFSIEQEDNEEMVLSPYVRALTNAIKGVTTVYAVVMFVYEGDNRVDSQVLADKVLKLLTISSPAGQGWNHPKSWRSLYGDRPLPRGLEQGIYG